MAEKLIMQKRSALKGKDGGKTFSVRVKHSAAERFGSIAAQSDRSRNERINRFSEFAVEHCEIREKF